MIRHCSRTDRPSCHIPYHLFSCRTRYAFFGFCSMFFCRSYGHERPKYHAGQLPCEGAAGTPDRGVAGRGIDKDNRDDPYPECRALLWAIFAFTLSHVFVTRKLCSIFAIIFSNFFMGMANVRTSTGTQGRADGSNIPSTARG